MAIAIYKARLIDGAGQAVEQATVIVQGNTIAAAGRAAAFRYREARHASTDAA